MSPSLRGARYERLVEHLHALGPHALGCFLRELAADGRPDRVEAILACLARYRPVDPAVVEAVNPGRRFARRELRLVRDEAA